MEHKRSVVPRLVNRLRSLVFLVAVFPCFCQLFCCARDVMERDFPLRDKFGETLVSAGEIFELGFFTPKGNSSARRYVGIWYKFSPATVVWVANRENPVLSRNGVFRIQEDGNLQVFDESTEKSHWSSESDTLKSPNLTAKLTDSGNLVLGETLWQSFENPTDTFLPGMKMRTGLVLTSWREEDDPQSGAFTFKQDDQEREIQYIISNGSVTYWKSGGKFASSDKMPYPITYMLSNKSTLTTPSTRIYIGNRTDYNNTRLVITLDGRIVYQTWDKNSQSWNSTWFEPANQCSIINACGDFGSCNAKNAALACKCLPGFKSFYPQQWNYGDFSGGCIKRGLQPCGGTFLNLTMMNLAKPESPNNQVTNETECRKECLSSCQCQAYSFQAAENSTLRAGPNSKHSFCSLWLGPLRDLQEGYVGGQNLFVRVALSDLESTVRNCDPCGTTVIPYPLSTRPGCGDPMYFSFQCSNSTGGVIFKTPSGEYQVTGIDPDTRKFLIEVQHLDNCDATNSSGKSLQLNQSLPFDVTNWCYTGSGNFSPQVPDGSTRKVEIEWKPPGEPTCASDADCKEWPNSNCKNAINREKRCLCHTNFRWDSLALNCTRDQENVVQQPSGEVPSTKSTPLALIVAPTVVSVAILACVCVAFIIRRRKKSKKQEERRRSDQRSKDLLKLDTQKRIKHLINSGEFVEEDEEAIDVPFFNFESIRAATDDFSDANKLGQGGYGPVYKGMFPGGQEIAVKRLSSVSGQGLQEFKNEVVLIAKLQHRNLVRLRGYCIKEDEKILLYEYMPNKSLDSFLFDKTRSAILDWEKRFNIILGIARGLLYLHQDSRLRIIHRDLKTSNILLDQEIEPKISDFGLARIVGGKQTEANTDRVVGTYGYMSPEYALEGLFSVKSDVFSFGVVLLEIISGKRNTRLVQYQQPLSLLGYAWSLWTENKVLDLIDPALHQSYKEDQFVKCFKIALLCVQEDPSERPTMSSIVTMLDSETATVPVPQQPAFVLKRGSTIASSSSSSKPDETRAEITVTLEEGR